MNPINSKLGNPPPMGYYMPSYLQNPPSNFFNAINSGLL